MKIKAVDREIRGLQLQLEKETAKLQSMVQSDIPARRSSADSIADLVAARQSSVESTLADQVPIWFIEILLGGSSVDGTVDQDPFQFLHAR